MFDAERELRPMEREALEHVREQGEMTCRLLSHRMKISTDSAHILLVGLLSYDLVTRETMPGVKTFVYKPVAEGSGMRSMELFEAWLAPVTTVGLAGKLRRIKRLKSKKVIPTWSTKLSANQSIG